MEATLRGVGPRILIPLTTAPRPLGSGSCFALPPASLQSNARHRRLVVPAPVPALRCSIARAGGDHRPAGDRHHPRAHRHSRRTRCAHRVGLTRCLECSSEHRATVHGATTARGALGYRARRLACALPTCQPRPHPVSAAADTAPPRDPPPTFLASRPMCRRSRYCAPRATWAFGVPHIDAPTANLNSHRRIQSGVGP